MIRRILPSEYCKGIINILFLFSNFEVVYNARVNLNYTFAVNVANHKWAISGKQNWRCGMNQTKS